MYRGMDGRNRETYREGADVAPCYVTTNLDLALEFVTAQKGETTRLIAEDADVPSNSTGDVDVAPELVK